MDNINKKYKVIFSEKAAEMLMKHVRFLAVVNEKAAINLRIEIIEASKSLQYFPERNAWISDPLLIASKYRKMVINKRFLLIYTIKDLNVYIDYIVDCRQEYKWLL